MLADMQESGIPVTYGYISDMHERKAGTSGCTTATATGSGKPIGPGDKCYDDNGKAYDAAFATFFERLAADGINAVQHAVRDQRRGERPVRRRQCRAARSRRPRPAATA